MMCFKWYYWAFQVKQLAIWCNERVITPWRQIEKEIVKLHRMTDIPFCGLKPRSVHWKFGPIIGNSMKIWFAAQKYMGCNIKLCDCSPVWYNYNLLQHSGSYFNDSWASGGIHILQDLYDRNGLSSLQMLNEHFSLPGFPWFLYLQLRSAIRAHGVPWDSPLSSHPLDTWISPQTTSPWISVNYLQ